MFTRYPWMFELIVMLKTRLFDICVSLDFSSETSLPLKINNN